jgi:hypothetical protein
MRAHLGVGEHALEGVVAEEADAGLCGVADDERGAARVKALDALRADGVANDFKRGLSLPVSYMSWKARGERGGGRAWPLNWERVFTNSVGYVIALGGCL